MEKLVRISIIKGVKGTPYGGSLQSSLRDRLVNDDKYEEAEEEALDKLVDFFQHHNFPKGANIIYHWPTPSTVKVSCHLTFPFKIVGFNSFQLLPMN